MLRSESACILRTERDDHARSRLTCPKQRPQQATLSQNNFVIQLDREINREVHNHPSGDPTPSRADIDMTREIVEAGKRLGIAVHDHLIIGTKGYASMKGLLLI